MGIDNLLPALKSCMDPVHARTYAGKRVGVDAYAWLHRGAYTCSQELCLGQPTTKWLTWCLSRCRMLLSLGVELVMVFDGGRLPRKEGTEENRRSGREKHRAQALALLNSGERDAAYKMFQKAVDITPEIARQFIRELRRLPGVQCIVAPYEADAQLAFLSQRDLVHAVITEDSDLIPFGCKRILYKMDGSGAGLEFRLRSLESNVDLKFSGWSHDMLLQMCIMAGCDYLPSVPGIGIKRAHALIAQHRSWDRAVRRVRLDGKVSVPASYERDVELALLTFKHQRVYDPLTRRLVHLTPPPDDFATRFPDSSFLGPAMADEVAAGIAEGRLDPDTQQPFACQPQPQQANAPGNAAAGGAHAHADGARFDAHFAPPAGDADALVPLSNLPPTERYTLPTRRMDGALPGFVRKADKKAQHQQQLSISAMFPRHPHQLTSAASAAAQAAAGLSSTAAAATASSLDPKQQKLYNVVGALFDHPAEAAELVRIPSELKHDFRPPRRSVPAAEPTPAACRDVTNTHHHIAASQPVASTPSKAASLFSQTRVPPSTYPQKQASKASERLGFFEQYAFGASSSSRASRPALASERDAEMDDAAQQSFEADDEYGFATREDEEAEADAEDAAAEEGEETNASALARVAPRRPNFLARSVLAASRASRPTPFSSPPLGVTWSPPVAAAAAGPSSPAAPMSFTLPAPAPDKQRQHVPFLSPSPPPPPPSTVHTVSKFFSAASPLRGGSALTHQRHSTGSIPGPLPSPRRAHTVPDASSFLHGGGYSSAAAVEQCPPLSDSDNEGRISDMDADADAAGQPQPAEDVEIVELEAEIQARRARRGAAKRRGMADTATTAATAAAADEGAAAKRFKSPLIGSSRMSLPTTGGVGTGIDFSRFVRTPSSGGAAGAHGQVRMETARTPSPLPSPPPQVSLQSSAAASQPFRPLNVPSGTSARFTVPAARAPLPRVSAVDAFELGYSSPPSDVEEDECPATPPSPSPSPRLSSSPSLSQSPPLAFSAPYVEHAAAGFSSQPEDWDEEQDGPQTASPRIVPAARSPLMSHSSFMAQFKYAPAVAAAGAASTTRSPRIAAAAASN